MRIAFRCDATPEIGWGHLARCRALAFASGGDCRFFGEGSEDPSAMRTWDPEFVVVDHYGLGADWELQWDVPVLSFEDRPNRHHACDFLLDANPIPTDYTPWTSPSCQFLLGAEFAVIRPEVVARRPAEKPHAGTGGKIVVTMGGSDPTNATAFFGQALSGFDVDFIVGPGYQGDAGVGVMRNPTDYLRRLMAADLVIGAPGGSAWERACLGVPSAVVQTAANQGRLDESFAKLGFHVSLGKHSDLDLNQTRETIAFLLSSRPRRQALIDASWDIVDGEGASRVWAQSTSTP